MQKIKYAKTLFEENITQLQKQKFKKQPNWNAAYLAYFNNDSKIIVPLKFENNYTISSNLFPNYKLSLEKQTYLVLSNIDGAKKIIAEVITYYPTEEYLKNRKKHFQVSQR